MDNEKTPAQNTMRELPDGVIELVQTGYQTTKSIVQYQAQIDALIRERRAKHKKALLLADISGITGHEPKVRDMAHDMLASDFDALAVITASNVTARLIGNWLVKLVGVGQRVQFFGDRDEGVAWLHSH
ncbi:MAG TPA: STAS/SEC14 domain-containing protein [Magnetospirillaceae bacterium]|nr:STAS/SEC14 domain-containing protein [Magnetospirillaceae bacterium]